MFRSPTTRNIAMAGITISTFGDYHRYGYTLRVHCAKCERTRTIDVSRINPNRNAINARFRCMQCSSLGTAVVSPPHSGLGIPDTYGMKL